MPLVEKQVNKWPTMERPPEVHFKGERNFETGEKWKVLGIISIQVDDLLISGSNEFDEYISWRMGDSM